MKQKIAIVYHSQYGHTELVAEEIARNLVSPDSEAFLVEACNAKNHFSLLHAADAIIFGSPTYFGNVSSAFKGFIEDTGDFWYKQKWKDKLAAGFTTSSTLNGDKLNALVTMALFAAQHGMLWISQGILPRFINNNQTDGQNRLGSYLGLMVQSDNRLNSVSPLHPGDLLTTELFAKRILEATFQWKQNKQPNN